MEKEQDYLTVTTKTRPLCGNYEFSAVLTKLAKEIHDQKDLSNYIENFDGNTLINPTDIALQILLNGNYDAYLIRDNDNQLFSTMYINPTQIEILQNYFTKQRKLIKLSIVDRLNEETRDEDLDQNDYNNDYEEDEDLFNKNIDFDKEDDYDIEVTPEDFNED